MGQKAWYGRTMREKNKVVGIWPAQGKSGTAVDNTERLVEESGIQTPDDTVTAVDVGDESVAEATGGTATTAYTDTRSYPADDVGEWVYVAEDDAPAALSRNTIALIGGGTAVWAVVVAWLATDGFAARLAWSALPAVIAAIAAPLAVALLIMLLQERRSARATRRHLRTLGQITQAHDGLSSRLSGLDGDWRRAQHRLQEQADTFAGISENASAELTRASGLLESQMQKAMADSAKITAHGDSAVRAMEALMNALPKIESVATRATDAMREAGQIAHQFGGQLEARIAEVRSEAVDSAQLVDDASNNLGNHIAVLRAEAEIAQQMSRDTAKQFADQLNQQRSDVSTLVGDLSGAVESLSSDSAMQFEQLNTRALVASEAHLSALNSGIEQTTARADTLTKTLASASEQGKQVENIFAHIVEATDERLEAIERAMTERLTRVDATLDALVRRFETLQLSGDRAASQTDLYRERGETLAGLVETIRDEMDVGMPGALARVQSLLTDSHQEIARMPEAIADNSGSAEALLAHLRASAASLREQEQLLTGRLAETDSVMGEQTTRLKMLEQRIEGIASQIRQIGERDTQQLETALTQIELVTNRLGDQSRTMIAETLSASSQGIENELRAALDRAASETVEQRLTDINAASNQAIQAATVASEKLMRQLITIADTSATIEARSQDVNAALEAGSRESLARQMSSLTDALQASAVDITQMLDTEIADQAWEAYLKGDRSVFARRSLRLLQASEAKVVLKRYEEEEDFRALVNRYVQEFETMLRGVMDTREGQQISVTLLSSDIGKVYVALAQAIERLRS